MAYKDIEKRRANQKKNYEKHREKKNAERSIRYFKNKDAELLTKRIYKKKRLQEDPAFKFITTLRRRHRDVVKGKISTTKGLGCTRQELLEHLSSQFTEGMTLENHGWGKGKWHIDHIFPISVYEEDGEGNWDEKSEYNKLLVHFTNLQPLWHDDNLEKNDSLGGLIVK